MAEGLLRYRLAEIGESARVHSAGLRNDGDPASQHGVDLMQSWGIAIETHRSRRMVREMLEDADLVLGMAREHVREAVILHPPVWPKAFTLKEIVRRGNHAGARAPGQKFDEWLAKVHAGRVHHDLLGVSLEDDVADPIGQGPEVYRATGEELNHLVTRLVHLGWGDA